MTEQPDQPAEQGDEPVAQEPVAQEPVAQEPVAQRVVVRHAPRYRAFVLAGVLIGVVVAVLLVLLVPNSGTTSAGTALIFVGLGTCALGALLGAFVAVLVDRRG